MSTLASRPGRSTGTDARERHVPVMYGEVKRLLIKSHGVPRDVAEYLVERYHRKIRNDYVYAGHGPTEIALDVVYEFEHSKPLPAAHAGRAGGHSPKPGWVWMKELRSKEMAQIEMMRLRRVSPTSYRVRSPKDGVWLIEQKVADVSALPRHGRWESAEDAHRRKHGLAAGRSRKVSDPGAWTRTEAGHLKYLAAYEEARQLATKTGIDVGIERNDLFKTFRVFMLPRPENRSGHELRAEVVRPGMPKVVVAGRAGGTHGRKQADSGYASGKHPSKKHPAWIKHEGALGGPGYAHKPMLTRHMFLNRSIKKRGYTATIRSLLVLIENHHMHSPARRAITSDIHWMRTRKKPQKK